MKGKSLAAYEAELEGIGLTNYNTSTVVNYDVENGYVTGLSKAPGEMFDLTGGETLMIYYADNPLPLDSSVQNNNTYVPQPAQTPANRQVVVETQPVPENPPAPEVDDDGENSENDNGEAPPIDNGGEE